MATFIKVLILVGFIATLVNCTEVCTDTPDCVPGIF